MSDLLIHADAETFSFDCPPTDPSNPRAWSPLMFKAGAEVDVPCFMRRAGPLIEVEFAVGNTSIVIGNPAATRPVTSATIAVEAGPGWSIAWDLEARPMPDNFPSGREFWRRLVLYPSAQPDLRPRAANLARGVFAGTWPTRRNAYGPVGMPLPNLGAAQRANIEQIDRNRYGLLRDGLQHNKPVALEDSQDGPIILPGHNWRPPGPAQGGDVGGTGIYFFTGWRDNQYDLCIAYLMAQCEHERMLRWCDRATGEIIDQSRYPTPTPDLWGVYKGLPEIPAPLRQDYLLEPYDFAHLIRGFRRTKQVALQGDSPMAKRSIAGTAATERLRFSERGVPNVGGGYNPVNLRVLNADALAHPTKGVWGNIPGRSLFWPVFCNALDILVNGPGLGRFAFGQAVLDFVNKAAMPTGCFQKGRGGSGPFPTVNLPTGEAVYYEQFFESVIRAYGIAGTAKQLMAPLPACVLSNLHQTMGPSTLVPISPYYGSQRGPWKFIATSDDKVGIYTQLRDGVGEGTIPGDATHAMSGIALAAFLDAPNKADWIERGRLYGHPYSTVADKVMSLTSGGATVIDWEVAWLAQAQGA